MDASLIDYQGETLLFLLSFVLFLGIVFTVGFVSRNLENAITFTLLSSFPLFLAYIFFHLP